MSLSGEEDMEKQTVAAASVENLVGQPDKAVAKMRHWIVLAIEQGAELYQFQ